jgi:hypothetical protein
MYKYAEVVIALPATEERRKQSRKKYDKSIHSVIFSNFASCHLALAVRVNESEEDTSEQEKTGTREGCPAVRSLV